MLKLLNGCLAQCDQFRIAAFDIFQFNGLAGHICPGFIQAGYLCAGYPFDQNLYCSIRQFQQLQDIAHCSHGEHIFCARIFYRGICLGE